MEVRGIRGGFGAEVSGVELGRGSRPVARQVGDLVRAHRLVVLRGQRLDVDAQLEVGAAMGELVAPPGSPSRRPRPEVRHEVDDPDGEASADAFFTAQWHADLSWCRQGARATTLLYAVDAGPGAAPTVFADMLVAYDALDEATQATIGSWRAYHHVRRSREVRHGAPAGERSPTEDRPSLVEGLWRTARGAATRIRQLPDRPDRFVATAPVRVDPPGALHPVVQTDPASGRRFVHLGDHAWTLAGVDDAAGRAFVDDLNRRIVEADNVHRHHWAPGDLVLYDNRSVLHRREPATDPTAARALRRCMVWTEA